MVEWIFVIVMVKQLKPGKKPRPKPHFTPLFVEALKEV